MLPTAGGVADQAGVSGWGDCPSEVGEPSDVQRPFKAL